MSELIRGVDLSKVDRKHLTKIVKSLKLSCDTSIDSMVATLSDHLVKLHTATPNSLMRCDFCGGSSDLTFDVCPFCGKNDLEAHTAAEAAPPVVEQPLVNARVGRPKKPREPKAVAAPIAVDEPVKGKPTKAPKAPKPEKTKPALAIVHTAELVSTKELDDAVVEIKGIQVDIVENHWHLGQALGKTWELYKLRIDEQNKPKYKNWGQFVHEELEIGVRYALDLVSVSRTFSQEDIRLVGVTKLRVIARIPDEAKKQNLLDRAKAELNGKPVLSRADVEKEARADGPLPPRATLDGRVNTDETVGKRAEKAKARAAAKGVTVVIQPGRITLPLFAGNAKKSKIARAHGLDDEPQAVEDLLNGIKVRYLISKEEDGLVLIVERVRE